VNLNTETQCTIHTSIYSLAGQNGTDKMVRPKWYGQNGTDNIVAIFIDSNSTELNFYSVKTSHK